MAKNLLIVESPAKAKTIKRYLGSGFQVAPSVGHVMDLPKSKLGVDLEHDFKPEYEIIKGKHKVIEGIKKAAKDSENIYLATDPDREGEAIAWHVAEQVGGNGANLYRVLLHEITPTAVRQALAQPSKLNRPLYEAQQARRVLDRLVGYQISPLLWEKVRRGISAGRVQSVALRIIVERERLREAFRAEEYWTLDAKLEGRNPPPFKARLFTHAGQRVENKNYKLTKPEVDSILAILQGPKAPPFTVSRIERKEVRRSPAPPFITSRLQQEAARRLYFSPSRTMKIAQKLYEGVEIGDQGAVGLITYMRTDSVRVSDQALADVRGYIENRYGKQYVPEKPNFYRSAKSAQEAHEAIRPTAVGRDPESLSRYLGKDELALYTLIFNRFVSSQMPPAVFDRTTVDIIAGAEQFRATGQVMKFDGFIRVYLEGVDETADDDDQAQLPVLTEGEILRLLEFNPEQHFTQPPPRFTQATLIKELEENGIGRPSTYASIMSSILNREYVDEDESKRLRPTSLGRIVIDLLVAAFPDIVEVGFTANMEEQLDRVEEGKEDWVKTLKRFYSPFKKRLGEARKKMPMVKGKGVPTDLICELDGGAMVIKWGRNGEFLACSNYPDCGNTKEFARDDQGNITIKEAAPAPATDQVCDKCGKPMVRRRSRFGEFLGCSGYPECNGIKKLSSEPVKTGVQCPDCHEGEVLERRSRRGKLFYGCGRYPKCTFASWNKVVGQPCPKCGSPYLVEKTTKRAGTTWSCPKEDCDYMVAAAPAPPAEGAAAAPAPAPGA
ncbi:MAG TPA: type I DNA topoisomerase [Candidatus Binataceae bacterium]|nr:type I DNA topoisomerase [Candidatus Binataceae bacterium]